MIVRVTDTPLDPAREIAAFSEGREGAVVTFMGSVRGRDKGRTLTALELEYYPGMSEKILRETAVGTKKRFGLDDVLVIHRHGRMTPGEPIVLIAAAAPHRRAAFEGAEFLMDWLKTRAPFWKKEISGKEESWVTARASDDQAADRWKEEKGKEG